MHVDGASPVHIFVDEEMRRETEREREREGNLETERQRITRIKKEKDLLPARHGASQPTSQPAIHSLQN